MKLLGHVEVLFLETVFHRWTSLVAQTLKASTCNAGDPGSIPWVRTIPWRRKWQPTPVLLPGISHGQRSPIGYSPWGHKESDTTEQLPFHFLFRRYLIVVLICIYLMNGIFSYACWRPSVPLWKMFFIPLLNLTAYFFAVELYELFMYVGY